MKSIIIITALFVAAMVWDLSIWMTDHNNRLDSMNKSITSYDDSIRLATSRLAVLTWQIDELERNR